MSTETDPKDLVIWRFVGSDFDALNQDFTILTGIEKLKVKRSRGRKVWVEYDAILEDGTRKLAAKRTLQDVNQSPTTDEFDLQVHIELFCEDGTVGEEKTSIVKKYGQYEAQHALQKRRLFQFHFLYGEAKKLGAEALIDALFSHYQQEIAQYKETGSSLLADSINNEADPTILTMLNQAVPRTDGTGMTNVKNSVLYQIGAIEEGDL